MFKTLPHLKMVVRFVGGLLLGVVCSGTVAGWLFALFEWLGVQMDPATGRFGPVDWAAMLATWIAAEFLGQTIAANVARSVVVIWFVAATHTGILLFAYYYEPHPALLIGAPLSFLIAYRLKDSDLLRLAQIVPARR